MTVQVKDIKGNNVKSIDLLYVVTFDVFDLDLHDYPFPLELIF